MRRAYIRDMLLWTRQANNNSWSLRLDIVVAVVVEGESLPLSGSAVSDEAADVVDTVGDADENAGIIAEFTCCGLSLLPLTTPSPTVEARSRRRRRPLMSF